MRWLSTAWPPRLKGCSLVGTAAIPAPSRFPVPGAAAAATALAAAAAAAAAALLLHSFSAPGTLLLLNM